MWVLIVVGMIAAVLGALAAAMVIARAVAKNGITINGSNASEVPNSRRSAHSTSRSRGPTSRVARNR